LIISVGGAAVKYNVYLREKAIELRFQSTDRSHVELAARLLKLAGVNVEVKKEEVDGKDKWYVRAYTDMLAAGRKELRDALAEIVRAAVKKGWVDEKKAEHWLEKLEEGLTLMEGWPKYNVMLKDGALEVRFASTDPDSIQQVARQLNEIGLVEGEHFTVKMPEGERAGYVSILKEGLAYAAWLSVHSKDDKQRRLAARFVEHILQRAGWAGNDVHEKAAKIVEEGRSRGSQEAEDFKGVAEVNGKTYVVKVKGGEAVEEKQNGKKLLRLKIKAEVTLVDDEHTIVDRVEHEYTITFSRRGRNNAAVGYAYVRAEADAERFAAVIKALTGREPKIRRMKDGRIVVECYGGHLEGFMRYTELADAIKRWLEETSRQ
jgi:hypothetical protein